MYLLHPKLRTFMANRNIKLKSSNEENNSSIRLQASNSDDLTANGGICVNGPTLFSRLGNIWIESAHFYSTFYPENPCYLLTYNG